MKVFLAIKFPTVYIPMSSSNFSLEQINNALRKVSAIGAAEKVNQFVAPADTSDICSGQHQKTRLHDAARSNNAEDAKLLLESGADIEARNVDN